MTDCIMFSINGLPRSWKAPQFNRKTGAVYKAAQDRAWQESIWGQAMPHKPTTPWTGAVAIHLVFEFPIPRSWPKWKREWVKDNPLCWPEGGPDWDNLSKAVVDAMKGIFFEDDRQIAWAQVEKKYASGANGPGVAIILEKLDGLPKRNPAPEPYEGGGDGKGKKT